MIALTCTFFILFRDKFARIRAHTGLTVLNVKKNVIVTMEPFVIILMDVANVFQDFKESRYDG